MSWWKPRGRCPWPKQSATRCKSAEALAHAAHRNVVHRDIKPSNLLITPEGQVKLIDMGLARLREVNSAAADLTASGITLGTFDYISPEQARDPRNADVRSDLYSLGCTFFYMLTGRPPFPGGTGAAEAVAASGRPASRRAAIPARSCPKGFPGVLRRTLAKEPRHRYADPAEMVADSAGPGRTRRGSIRGWPAGRVGSREETPAAAWLRRHLPWAAPLAAFAVDRAPAAPRFGAGASQEALPPPLGKAIGPPPMSPEKGGPAARSRKGEAPPVRAEERRKATCGRELAGGLGGGRRRNARAARGSPAAGPLDQPGFPAGEPADDPGQCNTWETSDAGSRANFPSATAAASSGSRQLPCPASATPSADRWAPPAAAGAWGCAGGRYARPTTSSNHSGTLIVGRQAGRNGFSSLARGLWRGGATATVIELRFDGPHEEQPLRLANLRVTIRGGEGYRPAVRLPAHSSPIP